MIANTPGSPVWDTTGGKFGPFAGQMFIGDQRQSNYFRCGVEKVDGDYPGLVRRLPPRHRVRPGEDVVRSAGAALVRAGGARLVQRRRANAPPCSMPEWDGQTVPFAIHSASLTKTGFEVTFTQPDRHGRSRPWSNPGITTTTAPTDRRGSTRRSGSQATTHLSEDRKTVAFDVPLSPGQSLRASEFPGQKNTEGTTLDFDTLLLHRQQSFAPPRSPEPAAMWAGAWSVRAGSAMTSAAPSRRWSIPLPAKSANRFPRSHPPRCHASGQSEWAIDEQGVMCRGEGHNSTQQAYGNARIHLEFRFDPSDDPEWTGPALRKLRRLPDVRLRAAGPEQLRQSLPSPTACAAPSTASTRRG